MGNLIHSVLRRHIAIIMNDTIMIILDLLNVDIMRMISSMTRVVTNVTTHTIMTRDLTMTIMTRNVILMTRDVIRMTRDINLFFFLYSFPFVCFSFILCDMQSFSLLYRHMFRLHVCFTFFVCTFLCSILLFIRIKHDEGVVLPQCSLTIGSQYP